MKETSVIFLCGIPASGKSTVRETLLRQYPNAIVISTDDMIKEMTGLDFTSDPKVWAEITEKIATLKWLAVKEDRMVIIDTTFSNEKTARLNVEWFKNHAPHYERVLWVLSTPLEECLRRNALRDRIVDPSVIAKIADALTRLIPRYRESGWFDRVIDD